MPPHQAKKHRPTGDEKEIWCGTRSFPSLYASLALIGVLALLACLILVFIPAARGQTLTWKIYLAAVLICLLGQASTFFYQRLNRWYVVTTERIIHREGIFVRRHHILELIRVDDVTFEQGPIEALFGCGSIFVATSDTSHPELELDGIEDVQQVAELIDSSRRSERKMRGIHVERI